MTVSDASPAGLTEALRVRALGLIRLDRDCDALADMDRLIELGDDTGEVRLLRAEARLACGLTEDAHSDLQEPSRGRR